MSEATLQKVDAEIRRILDEQYAVARQILDSSRDKMETMTQALMDWETIDRDQVLEIMAGKQPSPPKDYSHNIRQDGGEGADEARSAAPVEAGHEEVPAAGESDVRPLEPTIGPEADPQPGNGHNAGDVLAGGEGRPNQGDKI